MAQQFEHLLLRSRDPQVINLSSNAGIEGESAIKETSSIPYSVTKAALNMITLSLANVYTGRIRFNALCPSFVNSSWWEKVIQGEEENMLAKMLKNRNIAALEVKDVVEKIVKMMLEPELSGQIMPLLGDDNAFLPTE